jgi:hypothetical protein
MAEIKRMRYFQHEFLDAEDFNDEQEYHRQMRYRHNRDFHTWGIGHGLEVGLAEDQETGSETKVTVSPGTAVDGEGKEIILPLSRTIDFDQPAYQGDTGYYITVKWHEQPGLPRQEDSSKRWEEVPDIDVTADPPQDFDMNLVLARVKLRGNKTVESIDPSDRKYAALEIGDATVTSFKIADGAVTAAKIADKAVTNAKLRDGSVDEDKLSSTARGKLVTNGNGHNHSGGDGARIKHSSLTLDGGNNPHHVGMSQLSDLNANNRKITNLSDPAQNNEAANQGYVDAKDAEVKGYVNSVTEGKLVTNGNSHDHSGGDGAQIRHSKLNKDDGRNPHNTTAADVGALAITGGTMNGNISVNGNVGIGTIPSEKLHINGSVRGNISGALRINTGNGYVDIGPQNTGYSHFITDCPVFYFNQGLMVDSGCIGSYNQDLQLQTGGTTRMIIRKDNGNVGIGVLEPGENLHVHRIVRIGNTQIYDNEINRYNNDNLYIGYRNTKNTILQLNGGNVGIGTPEPQRKLDVNGDIYISAGHTILSPGRMHIHGEELLYLLHRDGVIISKAWDGNGNLTVEGRFSSNSLTGTIGYADFAEYFESKNGKEIKPGTSVVLDGDKIRPAKKGEDPIGIISANPFIAGGVPLEWPKKYLRDEFGNQIMEEYKEEIMEPKKEKVKKERQKVEKRKVEEKVSRTEVVKIKGKYCRKEVGETVEREVEEPVFKEVDLYDAKGKNKIGKHKLPVMETYEEEIDVLDDNGQPVMVGSGKFETKTRPKLNPEYDETKEYIPREKRPEWNCVGLLGQLPLRKGQPTAPTWIKIKDISKDVELWLVK